MIFSIFLLFFSPSLQASLSVEECLKKIPGNSFEKYSPQEAKGFYYYKKGNVVLLKSGEASWYLSPEREASFCKDWTHVRIPVKRVISTSTTHLAFINKISELESLVGFSGMELVNAPLLIKAYKEGKVQELGYPFRLEKLLTLKPDVIFTYAVQSSDKDEEERVKKLHLPLVSVGEFKENSSLARAEWLIFISLFYQKEKMAQEYFQNQKRIYSELLQKSLKVKNRPFVIIGELRGGVWHAAGGNTDLVRLIEEAGAEYLWKNKSKQKHLTLSFEEVILSVKAAKRPMIWLPQNTWVSMKDIEKADARYKTLLLTSNLKIYNSNRIRNENGYSDYWENALAEPARLLQDLVSIFHPELEAQHKPVWFWEMSH